MQWYCAHGWVLIVFDYRSVWQWYRLFLTIVVVCRLLWEGK